MKIELANYGDIIFTLQKKDNYANIFGFLPLEKPLKTETLVSHIKMKLAND